MLNRDLRRYKQLWPKMQLCKMAELRKRKWNLWCNLVAGEFSIRWQHLISFIIMYMVQLYKEDWIVLCMLGCWAIALPITKQIFGLTAMCDMWWRYYWGGTLCATSLVLNLVICGVTKRTLWAGNQHKETKTSLLTTTSWVPIDLFHNIDTTPNLAYISTI